MRDAGCATADASSSVQLNCNRLTRSPRSTAAGPSKMAKGIHSIFGPAHELLPYKLLMSLEERNLPILERMYRNR